MRSIRRFVVLAAFVLSAVIAVAQTVSIPPQSGPMPTVVRGNAALLDINTATPAQLKMLPGIGDAYAKRIVDGRPYTAKNQLVTRGVLPQSTYDKIAGAIIAKHPVK